MENYITHAKAFENEVLDYIHFAIKNGLWRFVVGLNKELAYVNLSNLKVRAELKYEMYKFRLKKKKQCYLEIVIKERKIK
jgi:hypothetical protein